MPNLSDFAITARWPARHPDRIQLYSLNTPNGVKVSIMLEETGWPYEPHLVDIMKDESHTPEFLSLNPNGKIPAIIDPAGPGGRPLGLFESGAILLYLADKTGKFIPAEPARRWEAIQWVFFQMASIGPMVSLVGLSSTSSPARRTTTSARWNAMSPSRSDRLLGVLDDRLDGRAWIMGADYSIAGLIATLGWVNNLITFYEAREHRIRQLRRTSSPGLSVGLARPAVQRGLTDSRSRLKGSCRATVTGIRPHHTPRKSAPTGRLGAAVREGRESNSQLAAQR